jgi:alpha-galactosidase
MATSRDSNGNLRADPTRFPSGIKALADYVHSKGLKLGIYGDRGTKTCMGVPESGSQGHEQQDANTFASWGVDYLKYDNCNATLDLRTQYELMSQCLLNTGRPIVFSICSWSFNGPWMADAGNLWRTTGDISDNWNSVMGIIDTNEPLYQYAGPGHWNDPDMLEVGNGGMTATEYRSHFSLWCIMAAPLIAGNDLRGMTQGTLDILTNTEAIAVDQDSAGIQGRRVRDDGNLEVWMKPLGGYSTGTKAVVLLNRGSSSANITVNWSEIGLNNEAATVRDLWAHQDKGSYTGSYTANVAAHGVVMLKIVGTPAPPQDSYLSDLAWTYMTNGWGPAEKDMSNGETASGDGNTITLNGTTYAKGLGVHANSEIRYNLGGNYTRFTAAIGVDDEVGSNGTVVFQVWADGVKLYDSGVMNGSTATKNVDVDITGKSELTLIVTDGGDNINYDHADWANAKVTASGS